MKSSAFRVVLLLIFFSLKEKLKGYKPIQTGNVVIFLFLSWLNLGDCNLGHGRWWLQIYGNVFEEVPGKESALLSQVLFTMT